MSASPPPPDDFNWGSLCPSDEFYAFALQEYHTGRSFIEIEAAVRRAGLAAHLVPELTTSLAKDRAFYLFSAGKTVTQVRDVLTERGLVFEDAEQIAKAVSKSRDKVLGKLGVGKWKARSAFCGGVMLVLGIVLYVLTVLDVIDAPVEIISGVLVSAVILAALGGIHISFGFRLGSAR
jgi:hypothetical protein